MADSVLASAHSTDPDDLDGRVVASYEAHHAELFALLARATLDSAAAEGLLEETFVRFASEIRAGRSPTPVRARLQRVACQLVIERSRRPVPARRHTGVEAHPPVRRSDMDDVLAGLSPEARLALLLSAQGVRGEGIALAIGRTPEATRTLLSVARSRVRLRRDLSDAGRS
jgi:RNA polymerase sigma-70 factor (ECF subfamily)